ncbi:MAG: hypothetical protein J1E96_05955 [Ruminococcus sp.]|nr:hypothetical protein [Ruminococcus sp.]
MTLSLCISVFAVILTLAGGLISIFICSENPPQLYIKYQKHSLKAAIAPVIVLVVLALLCSAEALRNSTALILVCAFVSALFAAVGIVKRFIPDKFTKLYSFIAKAVVVVFMLELTIFNFNSYDFLTHNYTHSILNFSNSVISGAASDNGGSVTLANGTIEFPQIDMPVGSITLDVENSDADSFEFKISYSDETNAEYRSPITVNVINGNKRSMTVPCAFSGNVSRLKISYTGADNKTVTLRGISLNNTISPDINLLRVFAILFFAVLAYMLVNCDVFKNPLKDCKKASKICTIVLSVVFVLVAFTSISVYRNDKDLTLKTDFSMTYGNQITQELVDSFEKGRADLDFPVDSSLTSLNNPYDWSERLAKDAVYKWDHVYYNGHYYSYYGIAPVIVLFLPYHVITGFYFPTVWAVMLFGAIGIVFLIKLLNAVLRIYFPEIPLGFSVMTNIIVLASCGVWFNFVTPNFYEIAQTSGFACITSGAYFLITSDVLGKCGKLSLWRLTLSSVLLALSVLCRPTLAVYCITAVLFIICGFIKLKKSEGNKSLYVKYFVCALLPFVVIGGVQMIYNYVRFDSFFDFGIDYSLTINDFTRAESHISQVLIGFVNFLFVFPVVDTVFPFIHSKFTTLDTNGYYFVANSVACGIIFKALPVFSYLFTRRAYRLAPKKERNWNTALIAVGCIIAPFVIIYSIAESGYGVRYATDFAWQIILGAIIIAFTIYCSVKNTTVKKILAITLCAAMVISVMINFAQLYEYQIANVAKADTKITLLNLARNFEFWK